MNNFDIKSNLLIFDLDGTLIDSAEEITFCVNEVRNKYGFPSQRTDEVRPKIGYPATILFADMANNLPSDKLIREFREILKDVAGTMCAPFPGVKKFLSFLHQIGTISAVATSKPTGLAEKILHNLDLHVTFIQGLDNFPPKPNPALLNICIRKFSVVRSEVIMIGDTPIDIEAGKSAATLTVALDHGTRSRQELINSNPDFIFNNFQDFSLWYQKEIFEK